MFQRDRAQMRLADILADHEHAMVLQERPFALAERLGSGLRLGQQRRALCRSVASSLVVRIKK